MGASLRTCVEPEHLTTGGLEIRFADSGDGRAEDASIILDSITDSDS
jgi:hypothetical protein